MDLALLGADNYWSSSENSTTNAVNVNFNASNGVNVNNNNKSNTNRVRAFLAFPKENIQDTHIYTHNPRNHRGRQRPHTARRREAEGESLSSSALTLQSL
ncbi:MAG: hypothetical protein IJ064_07425 [Bacteroidaceae bacterium]|nr:hypothetical protein [Bacteroidaceae bacterium]